MDLQHIIKSHHDTVLNHRKPLTHVPPNIPYEFRRLIFKTVNNMIAVTVTVTETITVTVTVTVMAMFVVTVTVTVMVVTVGFAARWTMMDGRSARVKSACSF